MPNDPVTEVASWITPASAGTADEGRTGEMPGGPTPLPITSAPVTPGEDFGPCLLLAPGAANYPQLTPWIIGRWDGEHWCDLEGQIVHPTNWAPLPYGAQPAKPSAEPDVVAFGEAGRCGMSADITRLKTIMAEIPAGSLLGIAVKLYLAKLPENIDAPDLRLILSARDDIRRFAPDAPAIAEAILNNRPVSKSYLSAGLAAADRQAEDR